MIEFETRVLNVNVPEITQKLLALGAVKVDDYFYKRYTYDYEQLKAEVAWFRLRTDGREHTLTYKAKKSDAIDGVEELETRIEDFQQMHLMMQRLHPYRVIYYENKRTKYQFEDIEFCLDTWPLAPTWLEIESNSVEKVQSGLKMLNLEGKDAGNLTVWQTFKNYYNLDLDQFQIFTFERQLQHQPS